MVASLLILAAAPAFAQPPSAVLKVNPLRDAYYGDLHLHTSYSSDAYTMGTARVDPDEAYRFAKGEVVQYLGQPVQRREPLDFLAVTDHSEMIGVFNELEDPASVVSRSALGKAFKAVLALFTRPDGRRDVDSFWLADSQTLPPPFLKFQHDSATGKNPLPPALRAESGSAWQREIEAANHNYEPGRFTTFIAYEWSSSPAAANLHRNVIFKGNSAPYPFTSDDSQKPEDLWAWLEKIRAKGYEALAIPHNGNASTGLMYDWVNSETKPIDQAYAEARQANEPLSEISQNKGASETDPILSPNDEFANYEIFDYLADIRNRVPQWLGSQKTVKPVSGGSYLRDALSRGLVMQRKLGTNPFKYGFVGASDLHSGLTVSAQADYAAPHAFVKLGGGKPTRAQAIEALSGADFAFVKEVKTTAGNLTGAWAESNTRDSIYNAFRRRETFATSGTKLKFRFFAGWSFTEKLLQQKNWIATAYAKGVPMGGALPAKPAGANAPVFAIWAVKDPNGAHLDRVQVIKVWEEDGQQKEKIFDAAWAGNRKPDLKTSKLPAVGDTVDLKTGQYTNTIGATELKAVWKDPDFNPHRFAAYYLRVLEIPTPRWSTLLAIEQGLPLPKDVPATEQQRGWSSAIWYAPQTR